MATNDLIKVLGTPRILEVSGVQMLDGAFAEADDDQIEVAEDAGYPLIQFEFEGDWTTFAGINNGEMRLMRRNLDIEGIGNHAPVPSATYPRFLVGGFFPAAQAGTQYLTLDGVARSLWRESYYLENATGETLNTAWVLRGTPYTWRPSI